MTGFYAEFRRHRERFAAAVENIRVGKISGAVGTYAHLSPELEAKACAILGLAVDPVSTQIIQRDRHAHYFTSLALLGGGVERLCTELRHLQRTEVLEVEEGFAKGQKGSSAMIAANAGFEGSVVVEKVREGKGAFGFNAAAGKYEDLYAAGVIDPKKVTRVALQNAASVASLLLTTECAVADKVEEKDEKK